MKRIANKYFNMLKESGLSVYFCANSIVEEIGKCGITENFFNNLFQDVKWGLSRDAYLDAIERKMVKVMSRKKKKVLIKVEEFLTPENYPEGMP